MKKILIIYFLTTIMLLVPITTNAVTVDIEKSSALSDNSPEKPQIFMTSEQKAELTNFIETNFEESEKEEAYNLLEDILSYDIENRVYIVDVDALVDATERYSYYHVIPQEALYQVQSRDELNQLIDQYWDFTNYPLGNLIDKIIEIIKLRLGWIYQLFVDGGNLFIEGVTLAKSFIQNIQNLDIAILFTALVNLLVSIPLYYFSESIKALFNLDINGFIEIIENFTAVFTTELSNFVELVEEIFSKLGEAFQPIVEYTSEVRDFVDWLSADPHPWQEEITVKGIAITLLGSPFVGAEVNCRGESAVTDSDGRYSFTVYPSDDSDDSIPPNSWYGLHKCVITISQDGEFLKQTPEKLSYVCSGGTIEWFFIIPKVRSREMHPSTVFIEKFYSILEKIHSFLPIFFRNINKIDVLSI